MSASRRKLYILCFGFFSSVFPASAALVELGQTAVGSSATANLTIPLTASQLGSGPLASVHFGLSFSVGACTLTANACQVPVTFSPQLPGSLTDAVVVKDRSGNLLSRTFLHGVGVGPKAVFNPVMVSVRVSAQHGIMGVVKSDQAGRIYFEDNINYSDVIYRLDPGPNSQPVALASLGIAYIGSPVVDPGGTVFYSSPNGLTEIDADTGATTVISSNPLPGLGAVDTAGNLYALDQYTVQRFDPVTGVATVVAGSGGGSASAGDGGPATSATLWAPRAIAMDTAGNLFIAQGDGRIREVYAATQIIQTIAGAGMVTTGSDGGPAADAELGDCTAITVDAFDNIYVADSGSFTVRKITATSQIITTAAGLSTGEGVADGGLSNNVQFDSPRGMSFDSYGNLFISSLFGGLYEIAFPGTTLPFTWPGQFGPSPAIAESILNFGNSPLTITSAAVSNPFSQTSVSSGPACSFPATLSPQAACQVGLTYQYSARTQDGTLTVTDNSLNNTNAQQQLALHLLYPQANLSATSFNFGTAVVSGSFSNQWLTITNPTNATLYLHDISFQGPNAADFYYDAQGSYCGTQVLPQSNCELDLFFEPLTDGVKSATLVITTNAANTPATVAVSGTAINPAILSASVSSLDFGSIPVDSSSAASITFTNTGDQPLSWFETPSLASTSGGSSSPFTTTVNTCGSITLAAGASCRITVSFAPTANGTYYSEIYGYWQGYGPYPTFVQIPISGTGGAATGQVFVPVTPCRIADTRFGSGEFGSPMLAAGATRDFLMPKSGCGIPPTAQAYVLNITVVPPGIIGYLSIWPTGAAQPQVSTLNSDGRVKAAAAIVAAGTSGGVSVYSSHDTQVVLDISGYFLPSSNSAGLLFYPLTPCRILDTRNTGEGPSFSAAETRAVSVTKNSCNVPADAEAYSLNFTAVPTGVLGYLSTSPAGQPQPTVSTLNSPGDVVANAAIVPAGDRGAISVFASHPTDVIVDVNGYFAAPYIGGLSFYPINPCRALDTRSAPNFHGPTTGTATDQMAGTCGAPATAQAFALNATVVPSGVLGYLALWPDGQTQPEVSTLNAGSGVVTSNMAIVPTQNGAVDFHASNPTYVILDISGYFAP